MFIRVVSAIFLSPHFLDKASALDGAWCMHGVSVHGGVNLLRLNGTETCAVMEMEDESTLSSGSSVGRIVKCDYVRSTDD